LNSWESNQVAIEPDCKSILVAHLELTLHRKRLNNPIVSCVDSDGPCLTSSKAMKRMAIPVAVMQTNSSSSPIALAADFTKWVRKPHLKKIDGPRQPYTAMDWTAGRLMQRDKNIAGRDSRTPESVQPYALPGETRGLFTRNDLWKRGSDPLWHCKSISCRGYFKECRKRCSEVKRWVVPTQGTDGLLAHCPLQYGVRLSKNAEIPSCAS
jgi:hypothetical protein